jgi:DNA-binding NarL/FixJ family response regulator
MTVQVMPDPETGANGGAVATMDPPRVLVVDDDQGFREMLRDFLADDGFDVIGEAPDGAAAFSLAQQLHPDVVLMDLRMPRMDGLEASRRIKSVLPITQIIMLSAYEDAALKRGAEEVGVYCYLIKGCPPSVLVDMLRFAGSFKLSLEQGRTGGPSADTHAPPAGNGSTG